MSCNNGNTNKCAACYKGGSDPAGKKALDKAESAWYNELDKTTRAWRAYQNAKAHKAYHTKKARWLGHPTGKTPQS